MRGLGDFAALRDLFEGVNAFSAAIEGVHKMHVGLIEVVALVIVAGSLILLSRSRNGTFSKLEHFRRGN